MTWRREKTWSRNKYKAEPSIVDGIRFDSKREAKRYRELLLLKKAGEIHSLVLQPKFLLGSEDKPVLIRSDRYPNGRRAHYRADFRYFDTRTGRVVIEDAKGVDTPTSKLKRAFVEWQYGVRIVLV